MCNLPDNFKLAKQVPYAIEQLKIANLFTNCHNCLNSDQASSENTSGCTPPILEEYLELLKYL